MKQRPRLMVHRIKAVSVPEQPPTVGRVKLFHPEAGRRVYADEVEKRPMLRNHAAVGAQLSIRYVVEFMAICRDVLAPSEVTDYDTERLKPPGFRSMTALVKNPSHTKRLADALDVFSQQHPTAYRETLEALYGTRVVVIQP